MRCMRPTARILFLICCRLAETSPGANASFMMARSASSSSDDEESPSSSSCEHTERTASSISITVDHINDSCPGSKGRRAFRSNERKTPGERVHEIWKPVWMWACMILADGNALVRVLEYSTSVVIHIEVIRCRENRDHRRELLCWGLTKHDIAAIRLAHETELGNLHPPRILSLVSADNA